MDERLSASDSQGVDRADGTLYERMSGFEFSASVVVRGADLDPVLLARALRIRPDLVWGSGAPPFTGGAACEPPASCGMYIATSAGRVDSRQPERHMSLLLGRWSGRERELRRLVAGSGWSARVVCLCTCHDSTGPGFSAATVGRLHDLGLGLHVLYFRPADVEPERPAATRPPRHPGLRRQPVALCPGTKERRAATRAAASLVAAECHRQSAAGADSIAAARATIVISGPGVNPSMLSERLATSPSLAWWRGGPCLAGDVHPNTMTHRAMWQLDSEGHLDSMSLDRHLQYLLGRAAGKEDVLREMIIAFGAEAMVLCACYCADATGPVIAAETLGRLVACGLDLEFMFFDAEALCDKD